MATCSVARIFTNSMIQFEIIGSSRIVVGISTLLFIIIANAMLFFNTVAAQQRVDARFSASEVHV